MQSAKKTTNVANDHNKTCNHVFYVSIVLKPFVFTCMICICLIFQQSFVHLCFFALPNIVKHKHVINTLTHSNGDIHQILMVEKLYPNLHLILASANKKVVLKGNGVSFHHRITFHDSFYLSFVVLLFPL